MPLYEYECDVNGHRFEVIRKFSDPPVETCPQCGSPVRKRLSSPAIQFKGTGFYITDYVKKEGGGEERPGSAQDKNAAGPAKGETPAKSDSSSTTSKPTASETTAKTTKGES